MKQKTSFRLGHVWKRLLAVVIALATKAGAGSYYNPLRRRGYGQRV